MPKVGRGQGKDCEVFSGHEDSLTGFGVLVWQVWGALDFGEFHGCRLQLRILLSTCNNDAEFRIRNDDESLHSCAREVEILESNFSYGLEF